VQAVACIGYGPGDAGIGMGERSLFTTMGSPAVTGCEGIYAEAPLRGILVWNSHAFNVTDASATLDMWLNFVFAPPAEQLRPLERFVDISAIAKMSVPAFGAEEICQRYVLPPGARLIDLASHTHKRGKRFRIFEGQFSCESGVHAGDPCSPFGPDPGLPVADLCAGAPCTSRRRARVGDCDQNGKVSVDELVVGVNIALGHSPVRECASFDRDDDAAVRVDELLAAVDWVLHPIRDPNQSLLYTSLTYGDPLILSFDPPVELGGPGAPASERTLTYCALYDNGFGDPSQVKRSSRVPSNSGPCRPTHCAEGAVGEPCVNDAQCGTTAGAGDGSCDACTVGFGITTDDEMFVLAGSFVRD
jgi:hypothetical protein